MKVDEKIRKRVSYKEFDELAEFLKKKPKRAEILRKIFATLDRKKAYGYERNAFFAQESLELVIKDRRLK